MEEIDLLELLKKWCKVLYKNKWWILGITTLVAVLSFVFTLPGINKPLKEVKAIAFIVNFPKNVGINQQEFAKRYLWSSEFKSEILEIYGEEVDTETSLNVKNFNKRIHISVSKTDISFVVRHESIEKAVLIINTAKELLSSKIKAIELDIYKRNLSKLDYTIELKKMQIDSLKEVIADYFTENKVLIADIGKEEVFVLSKEISSERIVKIIQEKSSMMLDMEQRVISLNTLLSDRDKLIAEMLVKKSYINSIDNSSLYYPTDYSNRLRIISISILLALFLSCGFFIFFEEKKIKILI